MLAIMLVPAHLALAGDHGHHGGGDDQAAGGAPPQQQSWQPPGQQGDPGHGHHEHGGQAPPPKHEQPGPPQQQAGPPPEAAKPQDPAPRAADSRHGNGHAHKDHAASQASAPAAETPAAVRASSTPPAPVSAPQPAPVSAPQPAPAAHARSAPLTAAQRRAIRTRVKRRIRARLHARHHRGASHHRGARHRHHAAARRHVAAPARWTPAAQLPLTARTGGLEPRAERAKPAPEQPKHTARHHGVLHFVPVVLRAVADTIAVIPAAVWWTIAALALFGLAMLGLAFARHRRASALAREREALIADIAALEGAVLPALPSRLGGVALSVSTASALGPGGGGDFHDAFSLSRDRVAIIIGDVAGQGRQALADAQLVRHAVRAYLEAGLDPRAAIAMTGAVVDEREDPLFASVLVAVHDSRDGVLTFASAGHEPPIFVTQQGAGLPPVTGWSPPLGTGLDTGRRQTSIPLPEGQAVCLLTDGVTEARSLGERVGISRVIKWLSALGPEAPASDIVERVTSESDAPEDDVTVCMLRALTPAATDTPRIEEAVVEGGDPTYLVRFLRDCGLPAADAEEAGEALAAAPDGTRMVASVEISGGRAVVELAPLRGGSSHGTLVG